MHFNSRFIDLHSTVNARLSLKVHSSCSSERSIPGSRQHPVPLFSAQKSCSEIQKALFPWLSSVLVNAPGSAVVDLGGGTSLVGTVVCPNSDHAGSE